MVPKLDILLVVRWPIGGIRIFIRYLYNRFDANRYHFTILAPENFELDMLAEDLASINLDIYRLSEYPSAYEIFTNVYRLISTGRFNLIHFQGFTSALCSAFPALVFRILDLVVIPSIWETCPLLPRRYDVADSVRALEALIESLDHSTSVSRNVDTVAKNGINAQFGVGMSA